MLLTKKMLLIVGILTGCLWTCQNKPGSSVQASAAASESLAAQTTSKRADTVGKSLPKDIDLTNSEPGEHRVVTSSVLIEAAPDTMPYINFDPAMLQALYEQTNYLAKPENNVREASGITRKEMLKTVELLQGVQLLDPAVLLNTFDFYRINTELKSDRVRITGYYTPLMEASYTRTKEFTFPLLRKPTSGKISPAAIAGGALNGKGLELAWLKSKKELKNAQLQGSGLVEFPDGKRQHFGFGGSVRGAGGTYVFFTKVEENVVGAGLFPLTAGYSVAVDPRFIPIGSTMFAELPDLDAAGNLLGYTYRILFAQDRGGAILSTKRLDLYCGVGQKGLQEARRINRFGRLWVMLPKGG
jgi:membrane-bound lytic murein transglycosylase A